MNKQILYILSLLGLLSFASCSNEENPMFDGTGEIRFSIVDTVEVEVTTKASLDLNVNDFLVNLSRGNTPIFSNRKFGDIAGSSITCSASPDYSLTVESCTEAEAESANQGWGQVRVTGREEFELKSGETKTIEVVCQQANASVSVDFSDFVTSMYKNYSIKIYATDAASRTFTFDERNYGFKRAYFNVGESGREMKYEVTLPSFKQPYTGTLTEPLEPSKNYKFSVKVKGEDTNTTVTLGVTVDGKLLEEIILKENINPYQ